MTNLVFGDTLFRWSATPQPSTPPGIRRSIKAASYGLPSATAASNAAIATTPFSTTVTSPSAISGTSFS